MTDVQLRELERRFRSSGSVDDHARWLRARVQAGDLEQARLELAARLGLEAAREALSGPARVRSLPAEASAHEWLQVEAWGAEAVARGVLACASLLLDRMDRASPTHEVLSAAAHAIEAWFLNPLPAVAAEIASGYSHARSLVMEHIESYAQAEYALLQVFLLVSSPYDDPVWRANLSWALRCADEATSSPEVHAALCTELIPWALGESDPVRMRVAQRGRLDLREEPED